MKSAEELWNLLSRADDLPYGAAKIAAVEQVLAHTEAAGDRELSFAARMQATEAYQFGGEDAKSFVTFSWCVADFDRDPAPFHAQWRHRLLWAFKWVVGGLTDFPEVPLARTYAVLDDMERRYREGGHSLAPVYKLRFDVAEHLGDQEAARKWYEQWIGTPRGELSDCAGCDPSARIEHLVEAGRDDEALEVAAPVLEGRLNCERQPQRILGALMVPYLRLGRLDEAADAHRRAYRINRTRPAETDDIADHLEFCARTGNEHRGLEILQRHVGWLDEAASPGDRMRFVARAALLLRRLTEQGHGDLVVRRPSGEVAVAELAEVLRADTIATARRFDARNGTDEQSRRMAAILDAEPYDVVLPLSPLARRRPVPVPAAPAPEPPVVVVDDDTDLDGLLDQAETWEHSGFGEEAAAVLDVIDRRFPAAGYTAEQAGRVAEARAFVLSERGDRAATMAAVEEAAGHYTRAGVDWRLSQARSGLAVLRVGTPDEQDGDVALIEADVEHQSASGRPLALAVAIMRRAVAHMRAGELDEALTVLDRAAAVETGNAGRAARIALQRSAVLLRLGRHDEAAEAADAAREHYRRHGPRRRAAYAHLAFGQAAMDAEAALAAYDEVLACGVPETEFEARLGRARELMRLERPAEAVDEYVEVVAQHTESGVADGGGAYLRDELARAYEGAGRLPEAAEVAEEAVPALEALGDVETADNARYLLAGLYRRLGDNEGALANYDVVIGHLAERDNRPGRAQLLMDAADLLYRMDRDAESADRFAAAAEDYRAAEAPIGELRALRRRVAALHWADDAEAAEATAAELARRDAELPPELAELPVARWERATAAVEAARMLARQDRYAEAVTLVTGAPAVFRELGAADDARSAGRLLAQLLDEAGEPDRAAEVRAEFD